MTKIYQRTFNPTSGDSLALVAKHIPPQSRVLDIGCGAGDLGQYLREEKQCYVVGLEYSKESITVAKDKLDKVAHIDLNQQMPHEILDEQFDVVVMADILEHIYTPKAVLQSTEKLLTATGKCLISIPNAGYVGALISLYDDQWQYREEGILDRTHIRFYTKKSVMTLLDDSGFSGAICDRVIKDLTASEFTQRIDCQPDAVRDWLLAKPEGSAYQFIVEARPKTQSYDFPTQTEAPSMSFQHIVKLFWQELPDDDFVAEKYAIARGLMGQKGTLSFPVNANQLGRLRLDFADRRGAYRIDSLKIFSDDRLLWSSVQNDYQLIAASCVAEQSLPTTTLAHHEQAFLLFELAEVVAGQSLRVEVDIHAPVDALSTAFIDSVSLLNYEKLQAQHTQVTAEFSAFHQEATNYIKNLEQQQTDLSNHIQQTTEQLLLLRNEKEQLAMQLNALLTSSSWKITAPLRKIIRLLKKS